MNKLNEKLEQINNEYVMNQKSINQPQIECFNKNENEMNIKEMMKTEIENTNIMNEKFNSFLTDKSICVNNPYYNIDNQPSSINTRKHEILNSNNNNIDSNNRLKQFQFQHYNNSQSNYQENISYNKLSPFDDVTRNKNKYVKKKNLNLTKDNHTSLDRAISTSHNINYEINENFKNKTINKITNKDISNERLNDFSPLAKTSQIPIKTKTPPKITDEMEKFLTSYNTFKESSLNTNYKTVAKETSYNNINPTYIGGKNN